MLACILLGAITHLEKLSRELYLVFKLKIVWRRDNLNGGIQEHWIGNMGDALGERGVLLTLQNGGTNRCCIARAPYKTNEVLFSCQSTSSIRHINSHV